MGQLLLVGNWSHESEAVEVCEEVLDALSYAVLVKDVVRFETLGGALSLQDLVQVSSRREVLEVEPEVSQDPDERGEELLELEA